ncbi:hypothetical protein S7711_09113 [Stachybotrys chartarum IBT 7711]|uniref:Nucleoside phosphorylase domain-containing protein n=1 Tax=Stachybotrys chartarum (strain CBS 109288 / IBT 7711) TaxID=1280523 RepID=A0A084ASC5_STACB|nr:hypothetical protein S7711_09113 [Stachybotrys chartarum IBT 7711]
MLDQVHLPSLKHKQDDNTYIVGQIAQHKIVITCLPLGRVGTTSAAVVAEHMRLTFTSLKFSLLVGIGGGVPSKKFDVRLGDVVVSIPSDTSPGVIQYDFGKTVQDGRFERTGCLNQPPAFLLSAVARLNSQDILQSSPDRSKISDHLAYIQAKYPRKPSWSYPGAEKDQLFKSDYDHEPGKSTCADCDLAQLEVRPSRGSDQPKVHYGLIASANQVMRNGATRERLRQETGALCVEMEAAGLMNNFQCLVIRGICDYADSHKNKDWQLYAAATAAAYARELLHIIL